AYRRYRRARPHRCPGTVRRAATAARADIVDTLRRHAHERATLVFVSDLEEAAEIADRIVRFDRATLDCPPPTSSIVGAHS
ncbi:hypothetical protein QM306_34480, partial [Burkholderia cenocepacia]|nr:hypothetical protein [Burkholderia cenocepacia]